MIPGYSDYIVYLDESGDHGMGKIDPGYPIFVLACCVFKKNAYINRLVPSLHGFKFRHFGHDGIILHEREIRKGEGPFSVLRSQERKEQFLDELTGIIETVPFTIISAVIDKRRLREKYGDREHPYHLSLMFCLERLYYFLKGENQLGRQTHITCEARGGEEDRVLELEFRRICSGGNYLGKCLPFDIVIAEKKVNCAGLQLADLVARPLGMSVLRPGQSNRAFEVIERKLYMGPKGQTTGFGLKTFP